mgnify:CR=1 FL=1
MKQSIPKGTRDFLPEAAAKRNYIFDTLKSVFAKYAYLPVETPAMEKLETLTGKYGEEGDRLIFKILSRGEKLQRALTSDELTEKNLSEEALRYDLTVPFARMVVQYQNEINFPFKRYQIQPVWRADRPQKGRYREFFQCDVDVIGSNSLLNEIELVQIIDEGFTALGLGDYNLKLNNRKLLLGLVQELGIENQFIDFTVALDKLDKIGVEGVLNELRGKDIEENKIQEIKKIVDLKNDKKLNINNLKSFIKSNDTGLRGLEEVEFVIQNANNLEIKNCEIDITLARGLNYYTGCIFEVVHPDFNSSLSGGGRYDDLTGIFGLKDVSGVGVSFGADRIFDLMETKGLFPKNLNQSAKILFVNFGDKEQAACLRFASELRKEGISTEIYPDQVKLKKQFKYADDRAIPFVAIIGENEINNNTITVKDLQSGEQKEYNIKYLTHMLKS